MRLRMWNLELGRVGLAASAHREERCLILGPALGTPLAVSTVAKEELLCTANVRPVLDRRAVRPLRVCMVSGSAGQTGPPCSSNRPEILPRSVHTSAPRRLCHCPLWR